MSINLQRPLLRAALFFIAVAIIFAGCTKPEEELGLVLQPGSDLLSTSVVDTFSIKAFTEVDDSVRTERINPGLVGAYNDPIFGFSKAGHITQLALTSNNPNLLPEGVTIDNVVVDSVVLVLSYFVYSGVIPSSEVVYGGYGEQYFQVFELGEAIFPDSNYYDNSTVNYIDEDLIKQGFNLQTPNPVDSIQVGGIKTPPQIRFPLNESFADRFFNADLEGDLNDDVFEELLKGIYITVDESQFNTDASGIISFDTFTNNSKIVLYYHTELPDTTTSYSYNFEIRSSTAKFNKFDHNFSNGASSLFSQLNGDTESGQQDLYVQSIGGTKLFVDFPFIETLRDSSEIAVNKAKIILPVRENTSGQLEDYPIPQQLLIFPRNVAGQIYSLQNDNTGSSGFYNSERGVYEFIISRYLQQVLLGNREHYGFEIVSIGASRTANRVVLNGPDYPNAANRSDNLKLEVTFTKF